MAKSIRQYIREEIVKNLEVTTPIPPAPKSGQQLNLRFKPNPVQVLQAYIAEKEDEREDTLAEIEMLLDDTGFKTGTTMEILDKIESSGKTYILYLKAMLKAIQKIQALRK